MFTGQEWNDKHPVTRLPVAMALGLYCSKVLVIGETAYGRHAVGLWYMPDMMPAPKVTVKTGNGLYRKLLVLARVWKIPVWMDSETAGTITRYCGIGDFVPPCAYRGAVEAIVFAGKYAGDDSLSKGYTGKMETSKRSGVRIATNREINK